MDDYSKFIKDPSCFIKSYKIKNGEIKVNTKIRKKIKKHTYKATKSKIKYYENILEKQYKEIIDNKEEILQSKIDIRMGIYFVIAMILCISSAISSEFSDILGMFLCGTSIFSLIISALDNVIYTKKFKSKMKIYDIFLKERKNIEKTYELGQINIKSLSNKASENIKYNKELKINGLIENIFNIDFMDKATLQDLRKLLYKYNEELKRVEEKDKIKIKKKKGI